MLIIGNTYKLKPKRLLGIEEDGRFDPKTELCYPGGDDFRDIITINEKNENGTFTFKTQNGAILYVHPSWVFHETLKEL